MKKIDWLILLFIFILSAVTLKDLLKPGFYTSHDGIHQVPRLYYFDQAVRDGQIPPRWAGGLLNGFGYPLFIFSYHMPWFIAEPFVLAGFSVIDSIKMTFFLGFIFSGITMYFFQKAAFGRLAAYVGTIVYLFAPFRFSNIFVRAAIGDATVFIFPPLLFLSLFKLQKEKKINWVWLSLGAVSLAGIILSHAMVSVFYFLCFALYTVYFLFLAERKKLFFISAVIILFLAFGLSSYYFIPSFNEREFTKFAEIMGPAHIGSKFVDINKLFYSSWGYGTMDAYEGTMSLQVGIAQWFVAIAALATLVVLIIRRRTKEALTGIFFLLVFVLSIFSMLKLSLSFWELISNIAIVDFPWRILSLIIFTCSILAGFVIKAINNKIIKIVIAIFIITLAFYSNRNHLRINQSVDWPLDFYLILEKTTNTYDEYTPKWVKTELVKSPAVKVESSIDKAVINIGKIKSNYLSFTIDASNEGNVRINTVYYPGWQLFVNGKPEVIKYDNGLIEFKVKKGQTEVVSRFTETPLRKISNIITLLTIGVIIYGLIKYRKI